MSQTISARPARHRLYIDESGDHTYNLLDDPTHRYLALLGAWFRQSDDYVAFADDLERFKREIFGARPDKPVILHRSDALNRKGPFGLLCNHETRKRFDAGLLEVIRRARFRMVCVGIDKQHHLNRHTSPFHPHHYCLAAMLDRYSGWLNYKNAVGDVMAESRWREEDLQLGQAYRRVYESGTLMFSHEHHQRALTSKDVKLQRKSANIAGLQLADVLAHPVKQAFLVEKGVISGYGGTFGKQVYEAVKDKFNRNERTGRVEGYGKVWLQNETPPCGGGFTPALTGGPPAKDRIDFIMHYPPPMSTHFFGLFLGLFRESRS
jgi:hypothetical protein